MIRAMKIIAVSAAVFFCMIIAFQNVSSAQTKSERQRIYLQRHVEKVKGKNPKEYKKMYDGAGGVIIDCMSCHEKGFTGQKSSHPPSKSRK